MTTTVPRAGAKRFFSTGGADTSGLNSGSSMAFPLAAAIIPAAASVVGSAVDALSQNAANKRNIEMQRETNEMNYRMFQEQNKWNLEQWKRENEYNSPSAQAERLRAAGINPAFVFGNGSISEASSLQSASPSPMVAPKTEPIMVGDQLAQGVYTGINAYNQSQLINAQTDEIRQRAHGLAIENDLKFAEISSRIANMNLDADTKRTLLGVLNATKDDEIALKKGSVKQQQAQTDNLITSTAYMKCKQVLESFKAASEIKLNNAQVDAISQQIAQKWQELAIAADSVNIHRMSAQAQNAYLGNLVIKMINDSGSDWERLGISKDMVTSEKFKNYVGSAASAIIGVLSSVGIGKLAGKFGGASVGLSPAASAWPLNGYAGY